MKKLKVYDIIQEPSQLTKVTRLPAEPFILIGNIWIQNHLIINHIIRGFSGLIYHLVIFSFSFIMIIYLGHYNPWYSPHTQREGSCEYLISDIKQTKISRSMHGWKSLSTNDNPTTGIPVRLSKPVQYLSPSAIHVPLPQRN